MKILDALILRLSAKGHMPVKVLEIIDGVFSIIREGGIFSQKLLNERLRDKGWEENILDDLTYDLIILCLAESDNYAIIRLPMSNN